MSADESETLTSLAKSLIALEQQREGPSATDEQRVFERLAQANAFQPVAAAAAPGGLSATAGVTKTLISAAVGALVGGAAVGAWFSGQLHEARADLAQAKAAISQAAPGEVPNVVRAESPPPQKQQAPALLPSPPQAPAAAQPATVSRKPDVVEVPKATAKIDSLSEEAALIDQARTALLKSDLTAASAALTQHQAKYPAGRMVEEREVMEIQVLLGQGREAEARAAADRFRKAHPSSLLSATIDELFERGP